MPNAMAERLGVVADPAGIAMSRQGNHLSSYELENILRLLRDTELTIPTIAERFGISRSAVQAVNLKFRVREYAGKRGTWRTQTEALVDDQE